MKRRALGAALAALFVLLAGPLAAADFTATVSKFTGKVQVQSGANWVPVKVGQVLPAGATVSTGFRSELQLKIGPSIVTVKPLSRLTIESLVSSGTAASTDLYLKVGKIDAEVNKNEAVQTQKFTVKSPVATASVRGTAFTFDGVNLQVTRGLVDFSDQFGHLVSVPVGEVAKVQEAGIADNQDIVASESTTQSDAGSDYGVDNWSEEDWMAFFDSIDYQDLLDFLDNYDWSGELPNTYIYIGGIY